MADAPERLFRDDAGAAFERAARLEQENQELRAEIRRIKRPDEAPTLRTRKPAKPHPAFFVFGALGGIGLAFGVLAATSGFGADRVPSERFSTLPAPVQTAPAPPGLIGASPMPVAATTAEAVDCETPFTYDEQGIKHYKQQCIHPERAK